jgi:uncharacterized protein (DUF427 family)
VEGNLYFPPESVKMGYLQRSPGEYTCPWKGQAGFYNLVSNGDMSEDAAWMYYGPSDAAKEILNYVAFDSDRVQIEGTARKTLKPSRKVR